MGWEDFSKREPEKPPQPWWKRGWAPDLLALGLLVLLIIGLYFLIKDGLVWFWGTLY